MPLPAVMRVRIAIPVPIAATERPVILWVTRSTTARPKITMLMMKSLILTIAEAGLGIADTSFSTASAAFR